MKRSQDRRDLISRQMEELGIEFEFFDAVDASLGFSAEHEALLNRRKSKRVARIEMTEPELGCALSHALVCQKIANGTLAEGAIVIEDDVIPTADFESAVNNGVFPALGHDMVLLFHNEALVRPKKIAIPELSGYELRRPVRAPYMSAAYYVSRHAAAFVSKHSLPIKNIADWGCDIVGYGALCMHPRLVECPLNNDADSTIGERNFKPVLTRWQKTLSFEHWRYRFLRENMEKIS